MSTGRSISSATCRLLRSFVHRFHSCHCRTLRLLLYLRGRPAVQGHRVHAWFLSQPLLENVLEVCHPRSYDYNYVLFTPDHGDSQRRRPRLSRHCNFYRTMHIHLRFNSTSHFRNHRHIQTKRRDALGGK